MRNTIVAIIAIVFLIGSSLFFGTLFGWVGALSAATIFICICLYYFFRTMRLLNAINTMPEGKTAHAEFFCAHIQEGMSLIKVTQIAQALGKKISASPSIYTWEDDHHLVTVTFINEKASKIDISAITVTPQPS